MLQFLLFHESTENMKDVSLTDMRMESIEGYGNGGSLCDVFSFCSGITQNVSFFCWFEG